MIGVRCATCGRSGLPPVPGSKLGAGELTHPVAHIHKLQGNFDGIADSTAHVPCLQGVSPTDLAAAADHPAITEWKEMITGDETLWEL